MPSSTIAIIITIITIISFVLEKIPLAMTAMIASLAMGIILPEMKLSDVYSGFSSSTVMMVAGRGYKLEEHFPEFIAQDRNETTARIVSDYRETISEETNSGCLI